MIHIVLVYPLSLKQSRAIKHILEKDMFIILYTSIIISSNFSSEEYLKKISETKFLCMLIVL